jgi:hypothetical protein
MTIVLKPDQEKALQEAIDASVIGSVDEFIDTSRTNAVITYGALCAEASVKWALRD